MQQVPLGVILLNENKLDEMAEILDRYMKLVPTKPAVGQYALSSGGSMEFDNTTFFKILFGGDYLTVARIRGAQCLRATHPEAVRRLEGVIPVVEDWHTRMTLVKVILNISILLFT